MLKLTNSPLMLGIVSFAGFMPILLVALFAGVVVDHVDRRRLIIGAQTLLMISAFVLGILTWAGVVKVEYVIVLAALNGFVSSFDMPGRQAFVVEMVGREDLPNAIAMNSMIFNGARMVGPAIAGLSIAVIGVAGCFMLNGVSYLAVIWSLFEMELPRRERREFGATMMRQVRLGPGLRLAASPDPVAARARRDQHGNRDAILGADSRVRARPAARRRARLRLPDGGAGTRRGDQRDRDELALDGSQSAAAEPRVRNFLHGVRDRRLWLVDLDVALAARRRLLIGVGLMNHMVTTNTLLQLFVSDELRGRVMSLYTLSFIGTAPIGSLAVGFIGEHLSPRTAVMVCAAFSLHVRISSADEAEVARGGAGRDRASHLIERRDPLGCATSGARL